jgi:hypothetical protein
MSGETIQVWADKVDLSSKPNCKVADESHFSAFQKEDEFEVNSAEAAT